MHRGATTTTTTTSCCRATSHQLNTLADSIGAESSTGANLKQWNDDLNNLEKELLLATSIPKFENDHLSTSTTLLDVEHAFFSTFDCESLHE
jgi:hypothetical protein